ncbi:hypothetical protein [Rufibacter tibetensis]|uniref:Lipoprotein n=1 Tax=Rufibacter tibetensis TaxID=512763 RepID=A0A0N7HW82_9BACT|nr:hypothetical protein [Rufibacter tibetensis]ALI98520.1 hypothetical protein DC20_05455 [Rufibacter tibetensis]
MRFTFTSFLLCLLLIAGLSGCGAELIDDPIMTAVVNGRPFTACRGSGKNIALPKDNVTITYDIDKRLLIKGSDSCKDTIRQIHLDIRDVQGPGTYLIDHPENLGGNSLGNNGSLKFPYFHPPTLRGNLTTSSQHTGRFILTKFDEKNRRLSATFEMDVYEPNSGFLYRIREGKLQDAPF